MARKGSRPTIHDTKCTIPGCEVVRSKNGLSQHLSKAHGIIGKYNASNKGSKSYIRNGHAQPSKELIAKLKNRTQRGNNLDTTRLMQLLSEGRHCG